MTFILRLAPEAQIEESEAYNYCEDVKDGLGDELLMELEYAYTKIAENPFYYSYIENSHLLRDMKIDRFPYVVIYIVSGNYVTVVSVRNTYRRPII